MKLTHLTDQQLYIDTNILVQKERKTLSEILYHLKEIDTRRLYADYKCTSLFDFCVKILKYSEGAAGRRIQAMRLLKVVPELMTKIENGSLSLTNIGLIACEVKNSENIKTDVLELSAKLENTSSRKAIEILNQDKPEIRPIIKIVPVSKSQTQMNITLKNETLDKITKLKNLLSNKNLNSIEDILDHAISMAIQKEEESLTPKSNKITISNARTPAVTLKRQILKRDNHKCTNCGSTFRLNIDHLMPYALGGSTTPANLRAYCFNCNQRARIQARL